MPYRHTIRVRYGELDPQGVVFNANYLAYCDDAMDFWLRTVIPEGLEQRGLDVMLKKAVIEWHQPARMMDTLEISLQVSRWGNTSFDVQFNASVRNEPVFETVITYVCVLHGTTTPTRMPDELRSRMN